MEFLIYSACFGVGLLFTIVSAFVGHLFGGHDAHAGDIGTGGHAEAGYEHVGMPGLAPFSPTTIASFLTAMGAFGMIFSRIEATRSVWISAPLAILGGLLVAAMVVWLFGTIFHHTQSTSAGNADLLIGRTATIITPIPAKGVGEIAYAQGGSRYTAPARNEQPIAVPAGETVTIVRIVGSQFYVAPLETPKPTTTASKI